MIIKRNGRKRSTDYYHPLSWGISIHSLALLRIHLLLHLPLPSPSPSSSIFYPLRPHFYIDRTCRSAFHSYEWRKFLFHFRFNIQWRGDLGVAPAIILRRRIFIVSETKQFCFYPPFFLSQCESNNKIETKLIYFTHFLIFFYKCDKTVHYSNVRLQLWWEQDDVFFPNCSSAFSSSALFNHGGSRFMVSWRFVQYKRVTLRERERGRERTRQLLWFKE